eukprot:5188647-Pyramimonas_sp.AAC.1
MVCYGVRKYVPDLIQDKCLFLLPVAIAAPSTTRERIGHFVQESMPREFHVLALNILKRSFFDLTNETSLPDAITSLVGAALRIRVNTPSGWLFSAVEQFAGVGRIDKQMRELGLRSIALDIKYDSDHLNILTSVGFAIYMWTLLATKA